jgi:hypothetical protein
MKTVSVSIVSALCISIASAAACAQTAYGWQWTITKKPMAEYIQEGFIVSATAIFSDKSIKGNMSGRLTSNAVPTEYQTQRGSVEWEEIYILQKEKAVVRCVEYHAKEGGKKHSIVNECAELGKPQE